MPTVSEFLVERLINAGAKHVFGVNGPFISSFVSSVNKNEKIKFIENVDDSCSGFAADAYARFNNIGCVCANYNTGALKLCNSVAGSYSERSPVVVVSGAPGIKERNKDFLSNHFLGAFNSQQKIFNHITCHSVILDDSTTAGWKIDKALDILLCNKQPIYIELPRDISLLPIKYDVYTQGTPSSPVSNEDSLFEAVEDITNLLKSSKKPVLVVGVQALRFGIQDNLIKFAEKNTIPIVTTLLSKSSIDERHPLFSGVYLGEHTEDQSLKDLVEGSDCLLIFGEMLTNSNAIFDLETPSLNNNNIIFCSVEKIKVKNHIYCDIRFIDICKKIFKLEILEKKSLPKDKFSISPFVASEENISIKRIFDKIETVVSENYPLIVDVDKNLLKAASLKVPYCCFISSAFYCSKGFSIPASLGIQVQKPYCRPIVLTSVDSFKISCLELFTIAQNELNPIIVLVRDDFDNEINLFYKMKEMIVGIDSFLVRTEKDFEGSFVSALSLKRPVLIEAFVS